jgi:SMC interacting uncharacterized protein involved in chromosome segregation
LQPEKLFLEFLVSAYADFLQGDDDYEAMEAKLAEMFRTSTSINIFIIRKSIKFENRYFMNDIIIQSYFNHLFQ